MSFELYKKEGLVEAVSFGSLFRKSPTIFSLYDETVTKQGVREKKRARMCVNKESIIHARTSVIMGCG
jgi:hypothetical protein